LSFEREDKKALNQMKIAKAVHQNLESQLEQYERLLGFAREKAVYLSETQDRDPKSLQQLVQKEVTVVSLLQELESRRRKICSERGFDEIAQEAGEFQQPLMQIKVQIKDLARDLGKINDRNKLLLGVSIKIVRKVIQAVKDLAFPEELTYSRIQKSSKVQSYNSVNLTA
jgi:hypothetical protein